MSTVDQQSITPFLGTLEEKDSQWFLGQVTWIRARAAQTSGTLGVIEQILTPGFASPYHLHHNEDEAFYVLEGAIRFISGDESWVLGPGGFAFLPRDIPHGFRVESSLPSRVLILSTPAGFEGFVAELSSPELPSDPPDMEALMQAAARHNLEILGPLPD